VLAWIDYEKPQDKEKLSQDEMKNLLNTRKKDQQALTPIH